MCKKAILERQKDKTRTGKIEETRQRERSKREREALPETRETREARIGSTTIRGNNISRDPTVLRSKGEKESSSTRQTEQRRRRTGGKMSKATSETR